MNCRWRGFTSWVSRWERWGGGDAKDSYIFYDGTCDSSLTSPRRYYQTWYSLKRAGVMVSDISSGTAIQPDILNFDREKSLKYRSLSEAMEEINKRLGADTIVLASQQYTKKDDSGKNVKFTHAIKRDLKSPDYSTSLDAFKIT